MSLRNALEELVIEEARGQIKKLTSDLKQQVNLSEVVAYSLNRLPPMYATTQRGWAQQRRRAQKEMGEKVVTTVRQALMGVRRDPLRKSEPLPPNEIRSQSRILARVQSLLGDKELRWRDVPAAVESALSEAQIRGTLSNRAGFMNLSRRQALDIKDYLKRAKASDKLHQSKQRVTNITDREIEAKEFDSYMLSACCNYRNVMENLVLAIAKQQMERLSPEETKRLVLGEVAAYALNHLPPMYATSDRGYKELRLRAKAEYAKEIVQAVRVAILKLQESPSRRLLPQPFEKIRLEQDEALSELRSLLGREDITWRNVAEAIAEAIDRKAQNVASSSPIDWSQTARG